jgi:hypothetical protein
MAYTAVLARMAEDDAREYIYELVNQKKLPDRPGWQDFLLAIPSNIPYVGGFLERGRMGYPRVFRL